MSVKRPSRSSAAAKATEWTSRSSSPAEGLADLGEDACDVLVGADVARGDERARDASGELADRGLDPLALVGEGELRAAGGEPLRDRPGDRAPVGDAEHEAALSLE